MADIINYKDKLLRGLRIWEFSLIAEKIRDDFIEEIAFDLSFEDRKGLGLQKRTRWERMLENRKEQD